MYINSYRFKCFVETSFLAGLCLVQVWKIGISTLFFIVCTLISIVFNFIYLVSSPHTSKIVSYFALSSSNQCHDNIFHDELWCTLCIIVYAKHLQALIDTTNNKYPAVSKKKHSDTSNNMKEGGGGPKPPVGVIPPHPSPPSKEVDTAINNGWLLLLLCFSSCFGFVLFDCCVCACYT